MAVIAVILRQWNVVEERLVRLVDVIDRRGVVVVARKTSNLILMSLSLSSLVLI